MKSSIGTRCIHYAGMYKGRACCHKGHAYLDVARPQTEEEQALARGAESPERYAIIQRVPCFTDRADQGHCPDQQFMTPQEIEAEERLIGEMLEKTFTARNAIEDHLKANRLHGKWAKGVMDCPVCGSGKLAWSYAGHVNGHIHGHCSTDGCVDWME